ncbi:unnamed protein product, partial [Gulo gulo]
QKQGQQGQLSLAGTQQQTLSAPKLGSEPVAPCLANMRTSQWNPFRSSRPDDPLLPLHAPGVLYSTPFSPPSISHGSHLHPHTLVSPSREENLTYIFVFAVTPFIGPYLEQVFKKPSWDGAVALQERSPLSPAFLQMGSVAVLIHAFIP